MSFFGEDRDTLIQKRVRLVQSGHFRRNVDDIEKKDINGLDDIVGLDYMGSADFEWGSLPKSLRRMTINKDFYKVFVFNQYKDENGNSLKVYAPHVFFKNIQNIVDRLAVNGYGLQEYCSLHRHIQKEEKKEEDTFFGYKDDRDFWWDIENDFFMFFEHTDKVLQAMDALRKRKFGYERNKAKSSLNRLYMKMLTRPNTSRYIDWNTSIKDYHYDKNAEVHFMEFLEDATLENIFMEAMIIAKVDKGTVVFNINGIPFSINKDSILDNIITENGINLVDSCTYSGKINELISQYNEEVQRKQKQTELVHVLRLVRDKKLHN